MSADRPSHGIIGWAYESAIHCNGHAIERFTEAGLFDESTVDNDGNPPHPVFSWDEAGDSGDYCDECIYECVTQKLPGSYADIRS